MKRSAYALLMALFLTALGLAIFIHKLTALNVPFFPEQAYDTWSVEARITLNEDSSALDGQTQNPAPADLEFYLPQSSPTYTVIDESFEGAEVRNSNIDSRVIEEGGNRTTPLTLESSEASQTIFYRATVQGDASPEQRRSQSPSSIGQQIVDQQIEQIARFSAQIRDNAEENFPRSSVNSLIREAQNRSSSDLTLAREIYRLSLESGDNRVRTIQQTLGFGESAVELAALVLNEAGVVTRVGNGILLNPEEAAATEFSQWLEVNRDRQWFAYDPVRDEFGAQTRYLTWWYGSGIFGSGAVLTSQSVNDAAIEVTARPDTTDGLGRSVWHEDESSFFLRHSFIGLPLSTQRVIQVLVLIPLGALIVAALHQMVGFRTFGTFTPVLIALSFRETGLIMGIVLFTAIVLIGVVVRSALNRAQLLVVPRLSAVLTVTVLVIGGLAIALNDLGLQYGLSISLFPIVILAMTIERAAVMWEEEGAKETAIAAAGSLFVAIVGYLCISNVYVQHWAFIFPELLLVVLALTLLLGRYNGYKLTEYFRFLALQKQLQDQPAQNS